MSYIVGINEITETPEEMADALREIARLIDDGFTSGYYPHWELEEQVDEDDSN